MYHNKKALHRFTFWLKFLSWYSIASLGYNFYLIFLAGLPNELYQSSVDYYKNFLPGPFVPPKWLSIGLFGGNLLIGFSPLVYFLVFQGSAVAIDYLLAFAEKMKIGEELEA